MTAATIFLGSRAKQVWVPSRAWDPGQITGVKAVCSVSNCLAEPPPGSIERWDFNRASCYETEDAALATIPAGERDHYAVFAYRLVPYVRNEPGRSVSVNPETLFDERLPALPGKHDIGTYVSLGYDVVSISETTLGLECSPLSCNAMAQEIVVNHYCLLDDLETALVVAQRFDQEQPEPGDYVVVEVLVRAVDHNWPRRM